MNHCCDKIDQEIIELDRDDEKDHSVIYNARVREYFVVYKQFYLQGEFLTDIFYCPFCGTKLPESLADKWFDVLEEEYGITDPHDKEYDKVPAEFRTDEWWKKRGL